MMTDGVIWRQLIGFAVPLLLGNLLQQLYNTVDSIVVGQFIGSEALAAVSSSNSLINLIIGMFMGISTGAGVVISQYYGAKAEKKMQQAVHTAITLCMIGGVILIFVGILFSPFILRLMGTPEEVMVNSVIYFRIFFCGSLFNLTYNMAAGILRAVGDSRRPLYYLCASSITNIVLDVALVVLFGMGVEGVAIATVASQCLSMCLALWALTRTEDIYRLDFKKLRLHPLMVKMIMTQGLPAGVQQSIISLSNVIVQANINAFGSAAMAGCGAYSKIEGFAFLPVSCFSMALATFVSQNIGARRYDRVRSGIRFGLLCSPLLAEAIGLGIFVLSPLLVAAFNSSPEVIAYGVADARTVSLFYFLLAFSHCCAGILRGTGRPIIPMAIMLATWCALRIAYITAVTHFIPDIRVIYWAYPLTWFLGGLLFAVCLLRLRFPSDAALETYK